ncbi:hypothetical protein KR032_010701 [Drosophila birchii]|nr:hypothetical protein KR032_010701 [Drosophila birchii]
MSHQISNFFKSFAQFRWPFHQHHRALAIASLLGLILLGVLDYGYKVHGRDLLWWRNLIITFSPLSILLYIVSSKMSLILALVLGYCIHSAVVKKGTRHEVMSITYLRRRFTRFLVMQLLASIDELVLEPETMDLEDLMQRHAAFATAVQTFRCQARKMFERSDQQVFIPQHVVLQVDDQMESELLDLGYAKRLARLRERDIYWLVYDTHA